MKTWPLAILFSAVITSCGPVGGAFVEDEMVIRAVEKQGYTYVKVMDKSIFFVSIRGCSQDDKAAYTIKAKNSLGQEVELMACVGFPFKGVTIRTK